MKIQNSDHKPAIDALEFALNQIYHDIANGSLHNGHIAQRSIAELQMIRVAYMLADRNKHRRERPRINLDERICSDCNHQMTSVAHAKICGSREIGEESHHLAPL